MCGKLSTRLVCQGAATPTTMKQGRDAEASACLYDTDCYQLAANEPRECKLLQHSQAK